MKLEKVFIKKRNKVVYDCDDKVVKLFNKEHLKSDVFNEALNQTRVEETGLSVTKVLEVKQLEEKWAIILEKKEGNTLEEIMEKDSKNTNKYMELFVDIQMEIHSKKSPLLSRMKEKYKRQIEELKEIDASTRYELLTRLDGMKNHYKVCHGDFNPSNIIISEDGSYAIIDWAHATQGNASADAAMTYLLFALKDEKLADLYMDIFSKKADIAKQYIQKWLSIVAAAQLSKNKAEEKEFLLKWIDIFDYQ